MVAWNLIPISPESTTVQDFDNRIVKTRTAATDINVHFTCGTDILNPELLNFVLLKFAIFLSLEFLGYALEIRGKLFAFQFPSPLRGRVGVRGRRVYYILTAVPLQLTISILPDWPIVS